MGLLGVSLKFFLFYRKTTKQSRYQSKKYYIWKKISRLVVREVSLKFCAKSHIYFLDKKQQKQAYLQKVKKMSFQYIGFFLKCCLKSHETSFLDKKQQQKDCKQAEKMLHFVKIVALVQGVYLESLSKILPIDLFLENKYQKKTTYQVEENVTFYKNCRSGREGFPEILSKILAFDLVQKF